MKKLITLSILLALTSSVFISCKSSSVMKRRYNKGYYVHHAPKHSEPSATASVKTKPETKPADAPETVVLAPAAKQEVAPAPAHITANAVKPLQAKKTNKIAKPLVKDLPAEFSIATPFKTLKNVSSKIASGDAAGDALSLLWVIIVIILVLYLLSFLFNGFGLGGFIHILAVIVLVLLILWLLRIL